MDKCEMKEGFFILRDCKNPGTIVCPKCNRKVCSKHSKLLKGSDAPMCLDCIGKAMQSARKSKKSGWSNDWDDDYYYSSGWGYGSRSLYYRQSRYSPWYAGSSFRNDRYYDNFDVRSFDNNEMVEDNTFDNDDFNAEADVFDS